MQRDASGETCTLQPAAPIESTPFLQSAVTQSDQPRGDSEKPKDATRSGANPAPEYVPTPTNADRASEINKELRRLNRALRALSACNQALARTTSEQRLLEEICDVIVRMGAYRFVWIEYAQADTEMTIKPMAVAGHKDGYLHGS